MKKPLIAFILGAVLFGVGTGIFLLELGDWSIKYDRRDLAGMPQQVYRTDADIDLSDARQMNIDISGNTGYIQEYVHTEIIEDPEYTESVKVEITYCGGEPYAYWYDYYNTDNDRTYYNYIIRSDNYTSFSQIKSTVQEMFRQKTFFQDFSNSLIKNVKITTAYPDKINIY